MTVGGCERTGISKATDTKHGGKEKEILKCSLITPEKSCELDSPK